MNRIRRELAFLRYRIEMARWDEWSESEERWLNRFSLIAIIVAALYFGGRLLYALWTGAL